MMIDRIILTVFIWPLFAGCSTQITRPESITLEDGLREVVSGLNALSEMETKSNNSLVPSEIEVTFQIATSSKNKESQKLEIVPGNIVKEVTGFTRSYETEVAESTGNSIKIKFRSLLFVTEKELVGTPSGDSLEEALRKARESGVTILNVNPPER